MYAPSSGPLGRGQNKSKGYYWGGLDYVETRDLIFKDLLEVCNEGLAGEPFAKAQAQLHVWTGNRALRLANELETGWNDRFIELFGWVRSRTVCCGSRPCMGSAASPVLAESIAGELVPFVR